MGRFPIPLKKYLLAETSTTIKFLILSDVIFISAKGLLGPVFALFIEGYIDGANVAVIGIAATVFLLSKSLLQIPFAHLLDKIKGECDDFLILMIGNFISALIPLAANFGIKLYTPSQNYFLVTFISVPVQYLMYGT
ncbi:MAG: hypothetical protein UX09_C0006G0001, partial [Candidatus Uhrbacteria bacterium GW2011_GWE2_45_35]